MRACNPFPAILVLALWALPGLTGSSSAEAQSTEQVLQLQSDAQQRALAHQQRIEQLDDESRELLRQYRAEILGERRAAQRIGELQRLVETRREDLARISEQRRILQDLRLDLGPRLARMIDALDRLVSVDLPFLLDERRMRVDSLARDLREGRLAAPDLARRILQAYLVEVGYGYDVAVDRGPLQLGDRTMTVDYLRLGRIGLYYLSLDGRDGGRWAPDERSWQPLTGSQTEALVEAVRIVRRELPPALVSLPVGGP